ncbi:hypothetical protein CEXT_404641 [Caerostris extrusa]|uniref:Uncharacterized protein n=1 Tax=Caerostris extrusa TaxID=172846 RepID=A0AAV4T939_CAEEX|nr:hypothetical protein CEXT_404641 [Caerostris extrusa]
MKSDDKPETNRGPLSAYLLSPHTTSYRKKKKSNDFNCRHGRKKNVSYGSSASWAHPRLSERPLATGELSRNSELIGGCRIMRSSLQWLSLRRYLWMRRSENIVFFARLSVFGLT